MEKKYKRKQGAEPKDARRHHYVPAGYIGLFAEPRSRDGKLHVWDHALNKSWISKPDKVACVEDLYRLDSGDPPQAIEDALRTAEARMIPVIRAIEANALRPPTDDQIGAIISFVSLQHVRGPEMIGEFKRFTSDTLKLMAEIYTSKREIWEAQVRKMHEAHPELKGQPMPTYEQMREMVRGDRFEYSLNNGYIVSTILRSQETVFKIVSGMQIRFYWVNGQEELVTGSQPVALVPNPAIPPGLPVGVATAEVIFMPLTPKLLFMARHQEHRVIASLAVPALIRETNRIVAHQSKQVYSRLPYGVG